MKHETWNLIVMAPVTHRRGLRLLATAKINRLVLRRIVFDRLESRIVTVRMVADRLRLTETARTPGISFTGLNDDRERLVGRPDRLIHHIPPRDP